MSSLIEKRDQAQREAQELADAFDAKQKEINLAVQQRDEIAALFNQKQGSLQAFNGLISEQTIPETVEDSANCVVPSD